MRWQARLYRLFTTDENVVRIGVDMMHFLLPSYFMYVVIGILSGALRGAGRVLVPMLLTCRRSLSDPYCVDVRCISGTSGDSIRSC